MATLDDLGGVPGFLKAGLLGNAGSGKTFTAVLLSIGLRKHLKLSGPIAMFDTEGGSGYVAAKVQKETGLKLKGKRSRSLVDLMAMAREAQAAGISVLIVDSMTHLWREVCSSYLSQINEQRSKARQGPLTKLEFQHWAAVKSKFAEWTDFFLNAPMHIIVAGRLGWDYEFEENEDGKKELVKTGVKMKTEGEFGYEPSLLIQMESVQEKDASNRLTGKIKREAMILKDRFDVIDGKTFSQPTFEDFLPHIELLVPGSHTPVDTQTQTPMGVNPAGEDQAARERRERTILCEEIQGELLRLWPGMTAAEKSAKSEALERFFGTRSWTAVEAMYPARLKPGLAKLREFVAAEHKSTKGAAA